MMKHKMGALIFLAGLTLSGVQAQAQAQPGQGGGGQGGRPGGGRAGMTPQQMQQMREEMMKTQMTALGVPAASQTTILAYAAAREAAARPLRAQARTLQTNLANNISAEAATRQLTALRDAVKVEKVRRAVAETELNTAIEFTKNPQLEAYLMLAGLIGDEGAILAPPGGNGRGGRGGQGGRQGDPGGGQGGPGGRGGGPGDGPGGPEDDMGGEGGGPA